MAIAIDPNRVSRYIPQRERDLPKEQQTVYLIRPRSLAAGRAIAAAAKESNNTEATIVLLRYCLAGWENLLYADGKPAQAKLDQAGLLTEESIACVPWGDRDELVAVVMSDAHFSAQTVGN